MAIIQVLLDGSGEVVGIRRVATTPAQDAFVAAVNAFAYGSSSGTAREAGDKATALLIEQSTKLTDAQKVELRIAIRGRSLADTVQFSSDTDAGRVSPLVLQDAAGKPKPLIVPFIDP